MQNIETSGATTVAHAGQLARAAGFPHSSLPETGRLLAVLTAHYPNGCIAEIGTGYGVGAAWISSALAPTARFITVELDSTRAVAVRQLLTNYPNVNVLEGDWHTILDYAPFDLLFADGGKSKENGAEELIKALRPGGTIILDDFTPEHIWTAEERRMWEKDVTRHFWLSDPRLVSTEIMVTPRSSVILATRVE